MSLLAQLRSKSRWSVNNCIKISSSVRRFFDLPDMSGKAPEVVGPSSKHSATVIFLHGLGDSGRGWSPVCRMIAEPHIKYICPHAPTAAVTLNMGMRMPSWYDIKGLNANAPEDMIGVTQSSTYVKTLIEEEIKAGIPAERIIVGGFSQGGAVALYTGFTSERKLGGIIALSTYMPLRQSFQELPATNKDTPVLMCHGDDDQVVAYSWGKLSAELLLKLGSKLTFKTYPDLQHGADPEELKDIKKFIAERLPPI
eukprot:Colp12_sorted_trinity150504_noHs@8482